MTASSCRIVRPPSNLGQQTRVHNMVLGLRVSTRADGDFVSPDCTWKLRMCPGLCRNGSTMTTNEVDRSLAVVRWGPQLLHSWLLKLTASQILPLWVHIYKRQIQPDGMQWWKSLRWVTENISMNWPVLTVVYFTQHLVYSFLLVVCS